MKTLLNLFLNYIQKNAGVKVFITIILSVFFGILYDITDNFVFIWFLTIPALYLVPLIITLFVYGFIVFPIQSIRKLFKK